MVFRISARLFRQSYTAALAWAAAIGLGLPANAQSTLPGVDSVALGTRPVTLSEAIRLAQQNAPGAVSARGAERTSQAAVRSAYGAFLPSVNASVGTVRQFTGQGATTRVNESGETVTIAGDRWSYSTGVSLNAQIFNFNRLPNLRAAKAGVTAAEQNTVLQASTIALQVEQQFFAAIAAWESEEAARAQLAQATEQLDAARRRVVAEVAVASDSLRATTEVANARLALLTARSNRRAANATLTRLTGSTVPLSAQLDDGDIARQDSLLLLDSASLLSRLASGPDVRQAEANLAVAQARRQAAKAGYFPTISAGYSRGGSGLDSRFGYGDNPFTYSGSFNLSLSYPLFNQFSREEQNQVASVNETNAETVLRDTRLEVRQLALQYLDARQLAQEQVAVQTASIAAAEEDLRVQQQRYELGLSTIVDVLTAQTSLNQARANLINARNALRLSSAQIRALLGNPVVTGGAQ